MSKNGMAYNLRQYEPAKDHEALCDICKNVYGGSDYLPKIAAALASDVDSNFVVLAEALTDRPAAVGNARKFKPNMLWLEAIRTCERHRSKGLARQLTQSLIDAAHSDGYEMYSCTIASNVAMQKVFSKVGMQKIAQIHQCSFEKLKKLPGWAADDEMADPHHILQSAGSGILEEGVNSASLTNINSKEELNQMMDCIKTKGGIGHLVGLYELLSDSKVAEGMEGGLLWEVKLSTGTSNVDEFAIMALIKEEKISSLKSPWVCSVTATNAAALEIALRYACSPNHCLGKLDGNMGFTVAFDLCGKPLPTKEESEMYPAIGALPLVDDACLLFRSSLES